MTWIEHVKQHQQTHGCSYKQALKDAKHTYKNKQKRVVQGRGQTDEYLNINDNKLNIAAWLFIGSVTFALINVILAMLDSMNLLRRRVQPDEMRVIRARVEQEMMQLRNNQIAPAPVPAPQADDNV